ncbi:MAG: ABC transporter ATP-binding protein [Oscillospiraceae bacterium]|jgi:oligopeptide/dipeptide ABC transporter ATP-binding protein|nr:ABC transporter ATP-binding protein [Oscillospiraceae bacterium]
MKSDAILETRNLVNFYDDSGLGLFGRSKKKQVLSDVSITIAHGEAFGIVGESGCGKSTLSKAVLGLIDYSGEIRVKGQVVSAKRTKSVRKQVQAVFQDPSGALNSKKRIGWTLLEPLRVHKLGTKDEQNDRVNQILELIGLDPSYKSRFPNELSGGQKQRICIGASLILDPELLVADEPVSALDVSAGAQILNLLDELHRKLNLSLLFISHNLNVVYYLCDRIAVMYKGQIVEQGSSDDIYRNARHPYTQALLAAVPDIDGTGGFADGNAAALREPSEHGCAYYALCPNASETCGERNPDLADVGGDGDEHLVRCYGS